jgi:hypothetical protein
LVQTKVIVIWRKDFAWRRINAAAASRYLQPSTICDPHFPRNLWALGLVKPREAIVAFSGRVLVEKFLRSKILPKLLI